MRTTITFMFIISLIGILGWAKSFHNANKSYYKPIPDYWQVKAGEVIIERELNKRLEEYKKWIEEQNKSGTS